ncbi:MAG: phosphoglycerate kinase [Desulfurococcales archaeon]|nr:phosphoglycerate kinase [Desulfurococcales archaeon]
MPFKYQSKTIASISDVDFTGKRVLVRIDGNSPVDNGRIIDDTRLKSHAETIRMLARSGARVIVLTHQGRPGNDDFIELEPHLEVLEKLIDAPLSYVDDVIGPEARRRIKELGDGEVLLLDNSRILSEDYIEADMKRHASSIMVRKLAPLLDYYVNDAFAVSHRSQASIVGFPLVIPSTAGVVMEAEVTALSRAIEGGERPRIFILGGAKLSDAVKLVKSLVETRAADEILTTGLVALLFLVAGGASVSRRVEEIIKRKAGDDLIIEARNILAQGAPVRTPLDFLSEINNHVEIVTASDVKGAPKDIGPSTLEYYRNKLRKAKVIVMRGPAGVIEDPRFRRGTVELVKAVLETDAFTIFGGGHFNAVASQLPESLRMRVGHISTGGGAMIYFLTRKPLPGLEALAASYEKFFAER